MERSKLIVAIAACVLAVLILGFVAYRYLIANTRAAGPPPSKPNVQNLQQQYSQSYTEGYMKAQSGQGPYQGGQLPPYANNGQASGGR